MWWWMLAAWGSEPLLGPVEPVPGGVRTEDGLVLTHRDLKQRYPKAAHDPTANLVSFVVGLMSIPVGVAAIAADDDPDLQVALGATAGAMYAGGFAGALTFRLGRRQERVRLAQAEGQVQAALAAMPAVAPRTAPQAPTPPLAPPPPAAVQAPDGDAAVGPTLDEPLHAEEDIPPPRNTEVAPGEGLPGLAGLGVRGDGSAAVGRLHGVGGPDAAKPGPVCGVYVQRPGTLRGLPEAEARAVDRVCVLSITMVGIEDMGPRTDDERATALLGATAKLPALPAPCRSALSAVQTAPAAMAAEMISLDEACGTLIPGVDGTMGPVQRWAVGLWTPWIEQARPHLHPTEAARLDSFWPLPDAP